MSTDSEVRALRRELAGTRAQFSQEKRNEIMAQLAIRGDAPVQAPVEKRAPGRPKKSAE